MQIQMLTRMIMQTPTKMQMPTKIVTIFNISISHDNKSKRIIFNFNKMKLLNHDKCLVLVHFIANSNANWRPYANANVNQNDYANTNQNANANQNGNILKYNK
jgi:hypothetical protein